MLCVESLSLKDLDLDPRAAKSKGGSDGDTTLIIIVIVVVVILLIVAVLALLYKKEIIPTEGCERAFGGGRKQVPPDDRELLHHQGSYPKRAAPQPPSTEYAELGPGGRINHDPQKTSEKSMYAQVKTDNVNYPEPEYEAPASVIV